MGSLLGPAEIPTAASASASAAGFWLLLLASGFCFWLLLLLLVLLLDLLQEAGLVPQSPRNFRADVEAAATMIVI